ncbi:DUF6470 family protein [Desulfosporosinus nitroreducens]|uniref:DUF6470 family protein n=1 Tax=Desulfosporosinus nitroreducens TaxID=2018668 RepID=A0ABT8QKH2_9FIRM|nr:DUF6470 family protein [Desulfosporosinus nitroreducens]MDO0821826.1 DUF6470 family protein [Desulfosporosinus nitroreducens]
MLRINISTQPIRLDYSINNAKLNLQTTLPKVQIETTSASVEITQPQGELTIDQTPCRYSIGLKNISDFARDFAALGRQTVMDTIARIAQEGDQLARIQTKSNAIADIAANSTISEVPDITYAYIALPDIHYQANPVQFNPTDGNIDLTLHRGTVEQNYQPGSVDIQISQYPSIEISTVDVKV